MLTEKQRTYANLRASGLGRKRAALEAGYSPKSAKVSASRMERNPEVQAAIEEARKAGNLGQAGPSFATAEDYLQAVIEGRAVPDPPRISAARTLIQYQAKRKRGPLPAPKPQEFERKDAMDTEEKLLEDWARKAEAVRARLGRK